MKGPTRHATNSTANLTETPRRHKPTKLGIISAKSFRAQLYMDVPTSPSSSSRRKFRWKRGGERLDGDLSEHSHRGRRPRSKSPIGSIRRSLRRSRDDSDLKLRTMSPIGRRLRRHVKDDIDVESPLPSVTRQNILHKMNPFSQRKGDNRGSDESNGDGFGSEAGESNHTSSFEARDRRGKRMTADESVLDYVRPEAVSPNRDLPNRNVSFDTQNTAAEDLGYETMSGFTDDLTADGPEVTRAQYGKPTAKKHRIRPYHCFDPPLFMTEEELYTDSMEPSVSFEHLQSFLAPSSPSAKALSVPESVSLLYDSPATDGRIGSLRVEVLGCVSLNRNKPDVAVYMVCGDSAFSTDVLHGYRSPMWPSASKRAAIFPIHHAFARLYIGVFDVKVRKNKENDVFCGRVAIDISSLRPETEYDATLPLRASTFIYDRRKRGVIRLRFSLYWFSERSAALSYFRKPVSLVESCPLVGGAPVIPCAEPKTFRNVAVAVHGQDLPGKYSRGAFRATMREFNLYQTNLRYLIKTLVLDAILYESPLVSLYLFCASLHCVTVSSMRWVPPYVVGYIIILLFKNYWFYVENEEYNCGYQPLTMWEVFNAVVYDNKHHESKFESISVAKRAKRRANKKAQNLGRVESGGEDDEKEVLAVDHHEFPFSDRVTYPRFGVEHALAPSSKKKNSNKGGSSRLHGRLSVYYTSAPPSGVEDAQDDESSEGDHSEEETMMTDGIEDNMFPLDMEGDDEDEIMDEQITTQGKTTSGIFDQGAASAVRRLKVGPAQNADTSSNNKVPPQIHLKKMENLLHKFTHKVSVQPVMAPETDVTRERNRRTSLALNTADLQAQAREKKRATYDEFDKLLGMDTRTANPVVRIMSAFLGPLMRMIRVFICIVRVSYNVSSWRDPFLTFWVFSFLCILCFILLIFPWQMFFSIATLVLLGPQNIFVRIHLEKKAASRKEEETANSELIPEIPEGVSSRRRSNTADSSNHSRDGGLSTSVHSNNGHTRGGRRKNKRFRKRDRKGSDADDMRVMRPAFTTGVTPTNRRHHPRGVVVPYSRLMKDRFYDWPPDPTVSRATPLEVASKPKERMRRDNLFGGRVDPPSADAPSEDDGYGTTGIRKRRTRHSSISGVRQDRRSSFERSLWQ